MAIELTVQRTIPATPEAVFALAVDAARCPSTFAGCGPIAALVR